MTDRDRLHTAKLYIDKLANGMNPMTGEDLPEDTILNDVSLCRVFVFVSNILNDISENMGKSGYGYAVKKEKFRINESQKSEIIITDDPVGVNTITTRIGRVLDRDVKNIPSVKITLWLEAQGLLVRETAENSVYKRATEDGELIGIETRKMQYGDREYMKTFYNGNAQAFIISNLEEIAKYGE